MEKERFISFINTLNDNDFDEVLKFVDKIVKELDKCILVCSNCHREIHDVY